MGGLNALISFGLFLMYYFLRQNLFETLDIIEIAGHTAETGGLDWVGGHAFAEPLGHQVLMLDPGYGKNLPDFFDTTIPVMSERLLSFLRAQGIDNVDAYPVTLQNIETGQQINGYSAVNFIGCLNCIKLDESEYQMTFGSPEFTGRIVIDEDRVHGAKCFRLEDGPGLLVISQGIADALNKETWVALMVQPTELYDGI